MQKHDYKNLGKSFSSQHILGIGRETIPWQSLPPLPSQIERCRRSRCQTSRRILRREH
ncbi:hypothetical protein L5515_008896 [Caenorhabditis briggsae]|uniref:Uncharacterized protein n=1 Tax=Caenorhabditis briggsae TaxID=6238 RepID=A0AAE9JMA9_CAEBR|nr:hypothetical protein L5515_008896 [Caenorhabditis briggsae]